MCSEASAASATVRRLDAKDMFYSACGKTGAVGMILMGVLFWLGHHTLVMEPDPQGIDGLLNLYKPVFYLIPLLMGYFVFSHTPVQETLGRIRIPLMVCAIVSGTVLAVTSFGQDNTAPQYLCSLLNNIYGWLMCLAMMGWFKSRFDRTGRFAAYMTRSSYGIYIILTMAVFMLSPLLYEFIRRIPFLRWCILGEKRSI